LGVFKTVRSRRYLLQQKPFQHALFNISGTGNIVFDPDFFVAKLNSVVKWGAPGFIASSGSLTTATPHTQP
jgi:hypothetical protein